LSKIILPATDAEWDAWEAEEAKKDEAYINKALEKDPDVRSSPGPRNSSKPFDLESFKKTTKIVIGAYAGSVN